MGFGFDDEEGVGGGVAGVAELLEGIGEGGGLGGEDYGAVLAADEVEAEFGLDELEVERHVRGGVGVYGSQAPHDSVPTRVRWEALF